LPVIPEGLHPRVTGDYVGREAPSDTAVGLARVAAEVTEEFREPADAEELVDEEPADAAVPDASMAEERVAEEPVATSAEMLVAEEPDARSFAGLPQ
jgi:hypothetical protein